MSADRIKHKFAPARINALTQWAERRGFDNPLRAAYAIAQTHSVYGMPSPDSYVKSSTGKRTDFLNEMGRRNGSEISDRLFLLFGEYIETQMDNIFENERRAMAGS